MDNKRKTEEHDFLEEAMQFKTRFLYIYIDIVITLCHSGLRLPITPEATKQHMVLGNDIKNTLLSSVLSNYAPRSTWIGLEHRRTRVRVTWITVVYRLGLRFLHNLWLLVVFFGLGFYTKFWAHGPCFFTGLACGACGTDQRPRY